MYPKQQTFLILGLSKSGRAAAEYLLSRQANTYIYDDITSARIEETMVALETLGAKRVKREDGIKMAEYCDVLVLSPGIPIDHPISVAFKRMGKSIVGESELAARYMRCPIVAVTGTNGKTTTVTMLTQVLTQGGVSAKACGNIGIPMISCCEMAREEVAVAEISSFQLETLNSLNPHIAVILNVAEDHLNRHYNMENYLFLKGKILKNLTESEYAILNYDDAKVRAFAEKTRAKVLYFSVKEKVPGAYYENGNLYFGKEKIVGLDELAIGGVHNVQNALASIAAAKLLGVKSVDIAAALKEFKGVKHRIEKIDEIDGVTYINDSKGTNVDATLKAIATVKGEVIVLLGGKDKGYDYKKLFVDLVQSNVVCAVLYGENRFELMAGASAVGFNKIMLCDNFEFAIKMAAMRAVKGQTVLLSPASASFDEFTGYEERGDKFVEIIQEFKQPTANETKIILENERVEAEIEE